MKKIRNYLLMIVLMCIMVLSVAACGTNKDKGVVASTTEAVKAEEPNKTEVVINEDTKEKVEDTSEETLVESETTKSQEELIEGPSEESLMAGALKEKITEIDNMTMFGGMHWSEVSFPEYIENKKIEKDPISGKYYRSTCDPIRVDFLKNETAGEEILSSDYYESKPGASRVDFIDYSDLLQGKEYSKASAVVDVCDAHWFNPELEGLYPWLIKYDIKDYDELRQFFGIEEDAEPDTTMEYEYDDVSITVSYRRFEIKYDDIVVFGRDDYYGVLLGDGMAGNIAYYVSISRGK